MLKPALFLDRDGVVIDYIPYLSKPEQIKIPDGAGEALKQWQDAGYRLILITNQSGVERGYFTLNELEAVHRRIINEYQKFGVDFHDILTCPHHPSKGCQCRKPSPYLILEASKKYRISIYQSFLIGDSASDLECAIRSGCQPVLLLTGRGKYTVQQIDNYPVKIPVYNKLSQTVELLSKIRTEVES
ncbi:MAG TPA: HAD family hydrolase [Cyanobacteria bacterium UBA12227]|nr:HAD family hydrolase [Cyanobacteria bacterium UBA12227]HAX89270.1 HAD family hydrolase [Cyanobacteria bacterium UBA11370]HBY79711.1 HAD family hydrolase [Cyanobacteria bacterium UBA11148]